MISKLDAALWSFIDRFVFETRVRYWLKCAGKVNMKYWEYLHIENKKYKKDIDG